jgi:translation initiation factor RLI1
VQDLLTERVENNNLDFIVDTLGTLFSIQNTLNLRILTCFILLCSDLQGVMQREVKDLSGGELQRFAIGVVCVKAADVYVFLSHYLFFLFFFSWLRRH